MLLGQRFVEKRDRRAASPRFYQGASLGDKAVAAFGIGTGAVDVEPRAELKGQPEVDELLIVLQPRFADHSLGGVASHKRGVQVPILVLNNAQENL